MILKDQKGAALLEFAIVLPLILLIALGIMQFGSFLNSYTILANATAVGARFFAAQGGSSTAYNDTKNQVITSAAALNVNNLVITMAVAGINCTDPNCGTKLIAGQGGQATVIVSYNNFMPVFRGSFFGLGAMMPTALNYSMAERVMAAQSH